MAEKSVNNTKKTKKPHLFKKGKSGNPNGRPKGSKNKYTEIKQSFFEAFEQLGGIQGLVDWAKKNSHTRAEFYRMITKILPRDINLGSDDDNPVCIILNNVKKVPARDKK